MIKLAITGNIACGKTLIGNYLAKLKIPIIDSDNIVHDLLSHSNEVSTKIIKLCQPNNIINENYLDQNISFINRQKLGELLFFDSSLKKQIEEIIHPKCREITEKFFQEKSDQGFELAINLIPLLFENNLQKYYDKIWLISCQPNIQKLRLQKRNPNLSDQEIEARLKAQIPQENKINLVDFVIDNSGEIEKTLSQVDSGLKNLAKSLY